MLICHPASGILGPHRFEARCRTCVDQSRSNPTLAHSAVCSSPSWLVGPLRILPLLHKRVRHADRSPHNPVDQWSIPVDTCSWSCFFEIEGSPVSGHRSWGYRTSPYPLSWRQMHQGWAWEQYYHNRIILLHSLVKPYAPNCFTPPPMWENL